jgi:hypothetical protein
LHFVTHVAQSEAAARKYEASFGRYVALQLKIARDIYSGDTNEGPHFIHV